MLARGETSLQLETDVPREFVIILQGILIMSVVVTYQVAQPSAVRAGSCAEPRRSRISATRAAGVDIEGLAKEDR